MIETWNMYSYTKGNTMNDVKFTFPFPITDCIIKMQFKKGYGNNVAFEWTSDGVTPSIEKISATEIFMKSRTLDYPAGSYISDLKVNFANGAEWTYLKVKLEILQNVTE